MPVIACGIGRAERFGYRAAKAITANEQTPSTNRLGFVPTAATMASSTPNVTKTIAR